MQFIYPLMEILTLLEESYFYLKPIFWATELLVVSFSDIALSPFIFYMGLTNTTQVG